MGSRKALLRYSRDHSEARGGRRLREHRGGRPDTALWGGYAAPAGGAGTRPAQPLPREGPNAARQKRLRRNQGHILQAACHPRQRSGMCPSWEAEAVGGLRTWEPDWRLKGHRFQGRGSRHPLQGWGSATGAGDLD